MEGTYQITPEMLGLSWRRLVFRALATIFLAVVLCIAVSKVFYGRVLVGSAIGVGVSIAICSLLVRPMSRTKLRLKHNSIEQLDGPVIRKDEIARVNEYAEGKVTGIEIIGNAKPKWLRDYRIFVPASLPQYEEVKRVVQDWADPQDWYIVTPL